ncbi:hypothetical protein [Lacipirellula parvula]|uniref:Uncharacterized protein n=1 Tax=Lacipirellula parvula TaxID=2650471 RepID=A0A5K7X9L2_9BACT|nr:hypothetical protein [Lacipirellula parvula]BBO32542.1 hypothetical protein PLANPX_2154 [Lacipirellula parvula]
MLDPRLTNIVKRREGHYEWLAHRSVKFHFSNAFSEGLVIQRLNGILDKLDKINGAPIPDRTLIWGFRGRLDDIPAVDKVVTLGTSNAVESGDERNPHLLALEAYDAQFGQPKSQRDEILEEAAAWQAKKDAEAARVRMESDPAWRNRHTTAGESYLLAHYTAVPESEYQLAEARLIAVNDPVAFSQADKAFKQRAAGLARQCAGCSQQRSGGAAKDGSSWRRRRSHCLPLL